MEWELRWAELFQHCLLLSEQTHLRMTERAETEGVSTGHTHPVWHQRATVCCSSSRVEQYGSNSFSVPSDSCYAPTCSCARHSHRCHDTASAGPTSSGRDGSWVIRTLLMGAASGLGPGETAAQQHPFET